MEENTKLKEECTKLQEEKQKTVTREVILLKSAYRVKLSFYPLIVLSCLQEFVRLETQVSKLREDFERDRRGFPAATMAALAHLQKGR